MENSKKNKIYQITMLIIITVIVTFMFSSLLMYNYLTKTAGGVEFILDRMSISEHAEDLGKNIEVVKQYLEKYYIGQINYKEMSEQAIKGYVAALGDEYTEYLTNDEYEELLVNVTGDFVGIGVYMYSDQDGYIVVDSTIEGTPAEEAGILAGDKIISVNGESCVGVDSDIVASRIKGKDGTAVELEIMRDSQTMMKTLVRRKIKINDSTAEMLDEEIGYIQLTSFDEGSAENIKNYLLDFQKKGVDSIIIDLRDNTGGIVQEAIAFSELFIEKGNVIMRSYDKANRESVVKSDNENPFRMNIILVVNGNSASATEIVAAALKDNDVATVLGTKTYGKGVMQEVIPLETGNGALKITTEEFKTPNGDIINKIGVTPDVDILDKESTLEDEQIQKALDILKDNKEEE